jgi:polyisoprenoid-binding protein YceI
LKTRSSEAVAPGPEPGLYQVAGQLQLHGVTGRVEFPARISVTPDELTFDGTMTVRQSEFGMIEAARKTKDEVPVQVSFRLRREYAPGLTTRL